MGPQPGTPELIPVAPSHAVDVVEAREADAAAFATFLRTAWYEAGRDAPGFAGASDDSIAEITRPDAFAARTGGPEHHMYLAWHRGVVVGFAATTHVDEATVELAGIVVRESMAGKGVGTTLVNAACEAAAAAGYREMLVRTETTNVRAHGFYERREFTSIGTAVEHVDGVPVDVVVLRRRLG